MNTRRRSLESAFTWILPLICFGGAAGTSGRFASHADGGRLSRRREFDRARGAYRNLHYPGKAQFAQMLSAPSPLRLYRPHQLH
jgi:hypothetical protein